MARIATFFLVVGAVTSGTILVLGLRSAVWDMTFLIGIGAAMVAMVFHFMPGSSGRRLPGKKPDDLMLNGGKESRR